MCGRIIVTLLVMAIKIGIRRMDLFAAVEQVAVLVGVASCSSRACRASFRIAVPTGNTSGGAADVAVPFLLLRQDSSLGVLFFQLQHRVLPLPS